MGRGSSKAGGGGGNVAQQQTVQNNPIMNNLINTLNEFSGHYTADSTVRDMTMALSQATEIGDKIVFSNNGKATTTFTKVGNRAWSDGSKPITANMSNMDFMAATMTTSDLAKTMAWMTQNLPGVSAKTTKWSYIPQG